MFLLITGCSKNCNNRHNMKIVFMKMLKNLEIIWICTGKDERSNDGTFLLISWCFQTYNIQWISWKCKSLKIEKIRKPVNINTETDEHQEIGKFLWISWCSKKKNGKLNTLWRLKILKNGKLSSLRNLNIRDNMNTGKIEHRKDRKYKHSKIRILEKLKSWSIWQSKHFRTQKFGNLKNYWGGRNWKRTGSAIHVIYWEGSLMEFSMFRLWFTV